MDGSIVRCASCGKANRLPADAGGKQIVCGNCRTPLGANVQMLTDATFDRTVSRGKHVDENRSTAARFGVQGIPLLIFIKDGREVGRVTGAVPRTQIEAAIQRYFG